MKKWRHILVSHITVICFFIYSITVPALVHAQDTPELPTSSFDLSICENITSAPTLTLTLPDLSDCEGCLAYSVGPGLNYRLHGADGTALDIRGLLLNDVASANLAAELTLMQQAWMAQYDRILGHNTACMQRQYSILDSRYRSLQLIHAAKEVEYQRIIVAKNDQIDRLVIETKVPFYKTSEFGVIVGVALGIGITIGAGYALGQIDR